MDAHADPDVARMLADLGNSRRDGLSTADDKAKRISGREEARIYQEAEARRQNAHTLVSDPASAANIKAWNAASSFNVDETDEQLENRYSGQGHRAELALKVQQYHPRLEEREPRHHQKQESEGHRSHYQQRQARQANQTNLPPRPRAASPRASGTKKFVKGQVIPAGTHPAEDIRDKAPAPLPRAIGDMASKAPAPPPPAAGDMASKAAASMRARAMAEGTQMPAPVPRLPSFSQAPQAMEDMASKAAPSIRARTTAEDTQVPAPATENAPPLMRPRTLPTLSPPSPPSPGAAASQNAINDADDFLASLTGLTTTTRRDSSTLPSTSASPAAYQTTAKATSATPSHVPRTRALPLITDTASDLPRSRTPSTTTATGIFASIWSDFNNRPRVSDNTSSSRPRNNETHSLPTTEPSQPPASPPGRGLFSVSYVGADGTFLDNQSWKVDLPVRAITKIEAVDGKYDPRELAQAMKDFARAIKASVD